MRCSEGTLTNCPRRLQEDIGEDDWINSEEQTFWQGAKLAFTDPKSYILVSSPSLLGPRS
jgi:hypothetical protein